MNRFLACLLLIAATGCVYYPQQPVAVQQPYYAPQPRVSYVAPPPTVTYVAPEPVYVGPPVVGGIFIGGGGRRGRW